MTYWLKKIQNNNLLQCHWTPGKCIKTAEWIKEDSIMCELKTIEWLKEDNLTQCEKRQSFEKRLKQMLEMKSSINQILKT